MPVRAPSKQNIIPLHRLSEESDLGLEIHRIPGDFQGDIDEHLRELGVHRDDHYVFMLQDRGRSHYWIDFDEWMLDGKGLSFIQPGQVHEIRSISGVHGWYLAADAHLVGEVHRQVLLGVSQEERWLPLDEGEGADLIHCLEMILPRRADAGTNPLAKPLLHALFAVFAGLVAERYALRAQAEDRKESRSTQVNRQFRTLLEQRFREEKRPQAYAAALNLSLSYLNEMIRGVSGFPVGHWIQYEVMLEARRLLYYSDRTVQEIAYELGYEDAAYFSRIFRQVVGHSPAQFRQQIRG